MKVPPAIIRIANSLKQEFASAAPAPFVGRFGYPNVNLGILAPTETQEHMWEFDAPRYWAAHNYGMDRIVTLRSSLVNSRTKSSIKDRSKFFEMAQEIGMASLPVDVEIGLKQKPHFRIQLDKWNAPRGPSAEVEKARITANPKISYKVEKVVDDTDLKSAPALNYLFRKGFDENFLSKLLSVGTLGIQPDRKLVPTRWSITAVDDTLGKQLVKEIKDFPSADYQCFFGGYLGNYYLILFFPDVWAYELFETIVAKPGEQWHDYEFYAGRKTYASSTVGGYYSVRLAVAEKLKSVKRQASVLVLRFVTNEYTAPLGVWVTREASRKSLAQKPLQFGSKELMLSYAEDLVKKKFGIAAHTILQQSLLLKHLASQRKLTDFQK